MSITPEKIKLEGEFYINGNLVSSKLEVSMGVVCNFLEVKLVDKNCWLTLYTFNPFMRDALGSPISEPIEYSFEGTRLGLLNENFSSDPREPEFYNRIVKKIYIKIEHKKDCIQYNLRGLSLAPEKSEYHEKTNPPGNWEFECNFSINTKDLQSALGLYPERAEKLIKEMSTL